MGIEEMMGSMFMDSAEKVQKELMIGTWTGMATPEQNGRDILIPERQNISSVQKGKRVLSNLMMAIQSGGLKRMGKEKKEEPRT